MQSTHVLIKHHQKNHPPSETKFPSYSIYIFYFLIVSPRIFDHLSKSHIQPPPTQPNPHGSTWIHIFTNMALQEAVSTSKLRIERCAPIPTGARHILQESQVESRVVQPSPKNDHHRARENLHGGHLFLPFPKAEIIIPRISPDRIRSPCFN